MKSNYLFRILVLAFCLSTSLTFAQEGKAAQTKDALNTLIAPTHRIVFQLATGDSMAHKQLMKQLANIVNVAPGTQLEAVCHGPGLDMLIAEKTTVADKIKKLKESGVVFNACEYSMKDRKIEKSQMIAESSYVPYALLHIASRQEQGWSYIKSGF